MQNFGRRVVLEIWRIISYPDIKKKILSFPRHGDKKNHNLKATQPLRRSICIFSETKAQRAEKY